MANVMLTTLSNPFNPFTQFDEWYDYDVTSGANSAALLARLALTSDEFTDEENDEFIVLRVIPGEGEESTLEPIDDPKEYDEIGHIFLDRLAEMFSDEEEEEN